MSNNNLGNKVVSATKWSAITEVAARLVSPISTMILARLLTPDAFGVLVTVTMVISFAEIFTDAGFQRYLIQHQFDSEEDLYKSTTVAFWTNLLFSILIWLIIIFFSSNIAHLVGNDGYGLVIAVSCICIPLEAFSSIQMALFKRALDFRTLFMVRAVGLIIPLLVTVPLAFITRSYWSLVIGMIAQNSCNAIILTVKSKWKPKWFYSFQLFKHMFSFTMWTMVEAITVWLTGYLDIFIVGTMLNTYYMGIYRTSMTTVGALITIVNSTTSPVLFSGLSRLQNDELEFRRLLFKFQKFVGLLIIPLGFGLYFYRDFVTLLFLGDQWVEASYFIGWWGLTSAFSVVFSNYCAEVFRAKGLPKYTVIAQCVHLCFLVPTVLIAVRYSFDVLCLSRSLVRLTIIAINVYLLYRLTKITFMDMLKNVWRYFLAVIPMFAIYRLLDQYEGFIFQIVGIILSAFIYFAIVSLFKEERENITSLKSYILRK